MAAAASDVAWRAADPHLPHRTPSSAAASMWSSARMTPTSSAHDSHASQTSTDATAPSAHTASPALAVVPATPPPTSKGNAALAPSPLPPPSPSRPPLRQQTRRKSVSRLLSSLLTTSLSSIILSADSEHSPPPPPPPPPADQPHEQQSQPPEATTDSLSPPMLAPLTPLAPLTLTPTTSLDEHRKDIPPSDSSLSSRDRCLPPTLAHASSPPAQYHLPHPKQQRTHPGPALLSIGPSSPASSQLSLESNSVAGLSFPAPGTQSLGELVDAIQAASTRTPRGQSAPVSLSASAETSTATLSPVNQVTRTLTSPVPSSTPNSSSTASATPPRRERVRRRDSILRSRSLLRSLNMSPAYEPASKQATPRGESVDSAKPTRSKSRTRPVTPSDPGQPPKPSELSGRVSLSRSASALSETLRARLQRKRSFPTAPDRSDPPMLPDVPHVPDLPEAEKPRRRTLRRDGGRTKRMSVMSFPTLDAEPSSSGMMDEGMLASVQEGSARSDRVLLGRPHIKAGNKLGLQGTAEPSSDGDRDPPSGTSPESEDVITPGPPSRRTSISGRKDDKRGSLIRSSTGGLLTRSVQTMLDLHTRRNSLTSRPAGEASFVRTHAHRGHRAEVSPFESAFADSLLPRPTLTVQTKSLHALSPLSPDSPSTAFRIADDLEFLHALEDVRRHHRESRRVSWDVGSDSAPVCARTRGGDRNSAPALTLAHGLTPAPAAQSVSKRSGHSYSASCTIPTRYLNVSEQPGTYTMAWDGQPSTRLAGQASPCPAVPAEMGRRRALSWTGDAIQLGEDKNEGQTVPSDAGRIISSLVQPVGEASPTPLGEPLALARQTTRTSLEYEEQSHVPSLLSENDSRGRHSWHANVVGRASGQEAGREAIENDADWAKEVKALFVIRELIQTERSYARHLECLLEAVQRALQRDSTSAPSMKRDTAHLTSLTTLLPPLIVLSQKLVECIESVPTAAGVGASFGLVADQLEATMIGWSFTIADVMTRLRATEMGPRSVRRCPRIGMVEVPPDSFFPFYTPGNGVVPPPSPQQGTLYLDEARPRQRSQVRRKALSAMDIVIMPTQRLPRYLLLLRELQAHTPGGSTASKGLEGALRICGRVADLCDGASAGGA